MVREAAERVVLALPRQDVCAETIGAPSLQIFDDRQPNSMDSPSLLSSNRKQLDSVSASANFKPIISLR
jgi:hypothetical protein